ncbi:MAG: ATP synthase F1 subunit gamma [Melioribacteraceae bacterium]|nr:ATP synthase F1 subunit gamma [Melioribacteraceae bacterium]MCF8264645.1 ATP synthase F1 subunit gamma [Melioribacteraceae bacterium]MCF8411981.1 ATP synthase F1 subunit gamma [Melioribacteraceae bacterium]MCF8431607.1 ATP synthase F1 subunit gamma [Melioribacteraceae bacterium]
MATLRDIKRRITGVKNTQQITKAMKMVSAARLRRAQENIINARPYAQKLSKVLSDLLATETNTGNPLLTERKVERIALVMVTSDRGLCGSFNMNIIRTVENLIKDDYSSFVTDKNLDLYCIGKKGVDYFNSRFNNVVEKHSGIFHDLNFEFASGLVKKLTNRYLNGEIDKVILVYNKFLSVIQQDLRQDQMIPVKPFIGEPENEKSNESEFIFEPNKIDIIDSLVPRHLATQLWTALLDSYAAELGARMTAMDMATENAKELIRTLQITYNKERQAAITTEILEIVSGANALKG